MKKSIIVAGLFFAILLAGMPDQAKATRLTYDADNSSLTITLGLFPQIHKQVFVLKQPVQGEKQSAVFHIGLFEVELTLTDLSPGSRPYFTMHYVIRSVFLNQKKQEGDISLPFGHGGIANMPWQRQNPSQFDAKGYFKVKPFKSQYFIDFGLSNLSGSMDAHTGGRTDNTITDTIYRDNGNFLAAVELSFRPRFFPLNMADITFDMEVEPNSYTLPDQTFAFKGVMPVAYGTYYFWFYRDK